MPAKRRNTRTSKKVAAQVQPSGPVTADQVKKAILSVQIGNVWSSYWEAHEKYRASIRARIRNQRTKISTGPRKVPETTLYSRICDRLLEYKTKTPDELMALILRTLRINNQEVLSLEKVLNQIKNSVFVMIFLAVQPLEYLVKFRDMVEQKRKTIVQGQFLKIELVANFLTNNPPYFRFAVQKLPPAIKSNSS